MRVSMRVTSAGWGIRPPAQQRGRGDRDMSGPAAFMRYYTDVVGIVATTYDQLGLSCG